MNSTRVSIGMPVRNGASHVAAAIRSLQSQVHSNWHLLISDNASTDETVAICRDLAVGDKRISLVTQGQNIGAAQNFRFVLNEASEEYFMWAAADDLWEPRFISTCIAALERMPDRGMAFTAIENVDSVGRTVRRYPNLDSLCGPAGYSLILRFLLQPEIFGKANLIYAMYRTELCRRVMAQVGIPDCWGSDMVFVLGAISRAGLQMEPEVLFKKRIDTSREIVGDSPAKRRLVPGDGLFPLAAYEDYRTALQSAVTGTKFKILVRIVMAYRYSVALCAAAIERLRAGVRAYVR